MTGATIGAAAAGPAVALAVAPAEPEPFRYCLNTSTIRGQKLPLPEAVEIAARAGYQGIEPWIGEIDAFVKEGGSLPALARQIRDAGLAVESAIGFFDWIVDDDARREKGYTEARRNMELVAALGGTRLAAPPAGAVETAGLDLLRAAERYRDLLAVGEETGVTPMVEVWGFSKTLSRLGEAALVAIESGHPDACILADVYHLHKGGSPAGGLRQLNGARMPVFHVNDYPADPPRERLADADRVYPGDGVAPLDDIFRDLRAIGFSGALSLELFNPGYWQQDALEVARTGLAKLRAAVERSLA